MNKYSIIFFLVLKIISNCGKLSDERCSGCIMQDYCDSCYESYFSPTQKECLIPEQKISNCTIYKKDPKTCNKCKKGYFLKTEKICKK